MKTVYRYYTLYRPPMPGAVPRDGLVRVECFDVKIEAEPGIMAWGYVEYTHLLTSEEIAEFELEPSRYLT